jgi:hypothetical protein
MTICGLWGCVGYGNLGDMGICEIWEYAGYGNVWDNTIYQKNAGYFLIFQISLFSIHNPSYIINPF